MYIDDFIQSILLCFQYAFSTVLLLPLHTLTIYYCFAGSNFRLNVFIIGTYPEWWIYSLDMTRCLSKLHECYKMSRIDIANPIKAQTIGNNSLSYTIVCVTFRHIRKVSFLVNFLVLGEWELLYHQMPLKKCEICKVYVSNAAYFLRILSISFSSLSFVESKNA